MEKNISKNPVFLLCFTALLLDAAPLAAQLPPVIDVPTVQPAAPAPAAAAPVAPQPPAVAVPSVPPVSMPAPSVPAEAAPVASSAAPAPTQAVGTSTALPPTENPLQINLQVTSASIPSFFYSPDEMRIIEHAKKLYGRQGLGNEDIYDEGDLLEELKGMRGVKSKRMMRVETEPYYAQFYLDSIVYHAPNDWVVWLKENHVMYKFTPSFLTTPKGGLKLLNAGPGSVTWEWHPINFERVLQTVKNQGSTATVDAGRKTATFTLRPNQTMFSYDMQIKEGEMVLMPVPPELMSPANDEDSLLPPILPNDITSTPPGAEPEGGAQGISGLLDTYQKIDNPEQKQ